MSVRLKPPQPTGLPGEHVDRRAAAWRASRDSRSLRHRGEAGRRRCEGLALVEHNKNTDLQRLCSLRGTLWSCTVSYAPPPQARSSRPTSASARPTQSVRCERRQSQNHLSSEGHRHKLEKEKAKQNLQTVYHQLAGEPRSSLSTASFLSSHQLGSAATELELLR